jgi:NAD(P)-dependent dehydrogenase (short-subunit alcohol dehydrogenase family)
MPTDELIKSYQINVVAPYLLITSLANVLTEKTASVVNIGSIHSRLTKPGFISYAVTKAALAALTRGLALDFEDHMRINCIEPASVETPMLLDGFKSFPEKKLDLERHYPQKRIATADEIAELAVLVSSVGVRFLHGACIDISGGISCRLHDPV